MPGGAYVGVGIVARSRYLAIGSARRRAALNFDSGGGEVSAVRHHAERDERTIKIKRPIAKVEFHDFLEPLNPTQLQSKIA